MLTCFSARFKIHFYTRSSCLALAMYVDCRVLKMYRYTMHSEGHTYIIIIGMIYLALDISLASSPPLPQLVLVFKFKRTVSHNRPFS
jgi:hypothetical protein